MISITNRTCVYFKKSGFLHLLKRVIYVNNIQGKTVKREDFWASTWDVILVFFRGEAEDKALPTFEVFLILITYLEKSGGKCLPNDVLCGTSSHFVSFIRLELAMARSRIPPWVQAGPMRNESSISVNLVL